MKKLLLFTAIITGFGSAVWAQQSACGVDAMLAQNPAYVQAINAQSAQWAQLHQAQNKIVQTAGGKIYEIPVVVHIIHSGQAVGTFYNPSDPQIQAWINFFNAAYAAAAQTTTMVVDTASGGVNVPIRLVLAARDPSCNATTGIVRVDGSAVYPNYTADGVKYINATGVADTSIKALSDWPRDSYYNIWIVNKIDNGAWLGYATFPVVAQYVDGAMMEAYVVQQPYTSLTFPHELGHGLGLLHTFWNNGLNSCAPNNNCLADGDGVCDTEPHTQAAGCPTGINACTGVNYNNVQYNIMNYSSCTNRFTAGQRNKMLFTLLNYRYGLLTSYGSMPPGINPPTVLQPVNACTPAAIGNPANNFNVGLQIVALSDLYVNTMGYNGDGNQFYVDHTVARCTQPQPIAHLHKDSTYVMTVTSGANAENVRAWIDFNNDGTFAASELVMSSNGTLSFETHTMSFTIPAGVTTCTPLRLRVASDISPITPQPCSNPQYGQVEDFIVIVNTSNPTATITASPATTVITNAVVNFSTSVTNGGNAPQYQWFKNGQPVFGATVAAWSATAGVDFITGDVISVQIISNALCTQPGPANSNALTMQVNLATGMGELTNSYAAVALYPNPNAGSFTLDGTVKQNGLYSIVINNVLGQKVYESTVTTSNKNLHTNIDLNNISAGVYYVSLLYEHDAVKVLKLNVAK